MSKNVFKAFPPIPHQLRTNIEQQTETYSKTRYFFDILGSHKMSYKAVQVHTEKLEDLQQKNATYPQ